MATAKYISPGVYEVNGKRINAKTSAEAIKKAGGTSATKPTSKTPAQQPKTPPNSLTPEQAQQLAQDKALGELYGNEGINAGNALIDKFNLAERGGLGMVSTDVAGQENIGKRNQDLLNKAGNSVTQIEARDKMQSGLDGYTSPENQAIREQMMRGQQSNMVTGMAQLAKGQARGKVYGAAAGAQVANLAAANTRNKDELEQDLAVKNIDEKQKRLQAYGQYGNQLNEQQYNQNLTATQNYNKDTKDINDMTLEREKINLGQENARVASGIGLATGAGATALAKAQDKAAIDVQKKAIQTLR